jgi:hypothetical protein
MRLGSFPKFALLSLAAALALALAGCGGTSNLALTQGNWAVSATSTAIATHIADATFIIGGNLTQTGSSVAGTMHITQSLCFDPAQAVTFTGTVKEKNVTLTSASVEGQVIEVKASGTKDSLTGTYTVTGGCGDGDQGTVTASAVPSISGTWSGTISNIASRTKGYGAVEATLSIALTQAATASEDGTFALTGDITYTNSACSVSGTITNGTLAGNFILINASTVETDDSDGAFSYTDVLLDSPTAPANMTGLYDVVVGLCSDNPNNPQTLTLTKQ